MDKPQKSLMSRKAQSRRGYSPWRNLYRDLSERLGIHGRKARPTPLDVQEMNVAKCERPRFLVRPDPGAS